jgi:hypothetical protein
LKITFEGTYFGDILDQMRNVLASTTSQASMGQAATSAPLVDVSSLSETQGPGPEVERPVEKPVSKPGDKPVDKKARSPKQLENDERLRVAAKAKIAAKKAAKGVSDPMVPPMPPPPKTAEGMDPAEVVRVRQKTIEELQAAYANGFQKEVFELLARFGNGAKSFRELPPDAFVPIREAIDNGALT